MTAADELVVHGALTSAAGKPLPPSFSERTFTFLPERTSLDLLRTALGAREVEEELIRIEEGYFA